METPQILKEAFQRYLENKYTQEDFHLIQNYFQSETDRDMLCDLIAAELDKDLSEPGQEQQVERILHTTDARLHKELTKRRSAKILTQRTGMDKRIKKLLPAFAIAAMLILGLTFIGVMFLIRAKKVNKVQLSQHQNDVKPGGSIATLTLANGSKVNLNDAKNGRIAKQSGVTISKTAKGQIIYTVAGKMLASQFNTIETPNGGEYQVVLPDGTKVWLNAASSLKYPISFAARKERTVDLTGEAYFEVAHNKAVPFRVKTLTQTVEVLGTHFNVNSYTDEGSTVTTLEEGAVKVSFRNEEGILKPGEQAEAGSSGLKVSDANMETALAWKNGEIFFRKATIESIMRQVSRWYNVEVQYSGQLPKRTFTGGIPRKSNLSALLKVLEYNDVHFTIKGRVLTVKP